ncbi:MAG: nucleolar RNA-binding Nop10p family protein [Candidatus Thermoplasmatota archaeon]
MVELFYCSNCEKYTLNKVCKKCERQTIKKKPPRYSPQDQYGEYRRKLKKLEKDKKKIENNRC